MNRAHEEIQDDLLVLQCQDGDAEAMGALIARWQARLLRFARQLTGEREATRDIVQDAWLAIVRGIRRLDDPARFRPWAYRIVANKSADWIRRRGTRRNGLADWQDSAADRSASRDAGNSADEVTSLRAALAQLPGKQRAMLSLHYLDEMGVSQIARVLNMPVGTVKSRLYHARHRLRQVLERIDP